MNTEQQARCFQNEIAPLIRLKSRIMAIAGYAILLPTEGSDEQPRFEMLYTPAQQAMIDKIDEAIEYVKAQLCP